MQTQNYFTKCIDISKFTALDQIKEGLELLSAEEVHYNENILYRNIKL